MCYDDNYEGFWNSKTNRAVYRHEVKRNLIERNGTHGGRSRKGRPGRTRELVASQRKKDKIGYVDIYFL